MLPTVKRHFQRSHRREFGFVVTLYTSRHYGAACVLLLIFFVAIKGSLALVRNHETNSDLQMLTVVAGSDQIFVAGTDVIYRYDRFLGLPLWEYKTGLTARNACDASDRSRCSRNDDLAIRNDAKILEIIPNSHFLLFCGSARRDGPCSVIDTRNSDVTNVESSDVFNYAGGNVCSFFSQPSTKDGLPHGVLYVAASSDRRQNLSASVVSIETSFDSNFNLRHLRTDRNGASAIQIGAGLKSNYPVRYIYGFEHKGFSYFVTVQRETVVPESFYETKLARVCQRDAGFVSYTEITMMCRKGGATAEFYNIAQAAYVSTVGKELGRRFGFNSDETMLYIVYGMSRSKTSEASESLGSGLCVYSMSDVTKAFTNAQKDCYSGNGNILAWINPREPKCRADVTIATEMNESFCGRSTNVGIGGRYGSLQTNTNFTTEDYLTTSLRVITFLNKTIALIGTMSGHLLKVVIDGIHDTVPYSVIDVGFGSPIVRDMEFDGTQEYIYVLSGKMISMVPLKSCSVYSDCSSCVMTDDPMNCGWCDDHCTTKSECITQWLDEHCPPVIHSFSPQMGPVEGGTIVTINGQNFGNGSLPTVRITATECLVQYRDSSRIVCKTLRTESPREREIKVTVMDVSKTTVDFEIRGTAASGHDSFSYKVASISSISPLIGPKSGSTQLNVTGTNLEIGSSLFVTVLDKPCNVTRVTSNQITCYTSSLNSLRSSTEDKEGHRGQVIVRIDDAEPSHQRFEFLYSEDPVIFNVTPRVSILSGGMNLTVTGKNLNCIKKPLLVVNVVGNDTKYSDECHSEISGTIMICRTPNMKLASHRFNADGRILTEMRFAMDGVRDLWQFPTSQPNMSRLSYTDDPQILPYPENGSIDMFELNQQSLRLQGIRLNLSATICDYRITIGDVACNVTLLTSNFLMCHPQTSLSHRHRKDILVTVGRLHFFPGQMLLKERHEGGNQLFSLGVPVLLSSILITIIFIIVCLLCLKSLHRGPFRRKFQTVPNVLYSGGSELDIRGNHSVDGAVPCVNHVPNSYLSHSEAIHQRLFTGGHASREPILDDESRRLFSDSHLLINRDCLLLLDIIGQGHFGCVLRGYLKLGPKVEMEVAVKTLKSLTESIYTSPLESRKFLEEALTMREFDHVHVLKLIGIVIDKEELPLVVLPFMRHGDLLSYIRNEYNSPTVKELMEFGMQIADGMTYLSNLKFVHRDLAARNCMLDDDMLVKVADFGLSRDIYERDYYSSDDRKAKLPVKWMALESLEKGIYNTKTDVWSFGVVLWELMTRGVCPYPEVDNWDIIKYLKSGRRMPQPSYCPDALYNIMLHCWNPNHTERPIFNELRDTIRGLIETMAGVHRRVGLDVTYVNANLHGQGYLCPVESRGGEEAEAEAAADEYGNHHSTYTSAASDNSTLV